MDGLYRRVMRRTYKQILRKLPEGTVIETKPLGRGRNGKSNSVIAIHDGKVILSGAIPERGPITNLFVEPHIWFRYQPEVPPKPPALSPVEKRTVLPLEQPKLRDMPLYAFKNLVRGLLKTDGYKATYQRLGLSGNVVYVRDMRIPSAPTTVLSGIVRKNVKLVQGVQGPFHYGDDRRPVPPRQSLNPLIPRGSQNG